jgi:hypothetical protein
LRGARFWRRQPDTCPLDAQAFLAASLKTDAELLKWFRDRLVWNEPETVVDLLKNGLFVRLYEPQVRMPDVPSWTVGTVRGRVAHAGCCCVQVIIRGFMAADESAQVTDTADAGQADAPPGQAAAGSTHISMRSSSMLSEKS